jgi:hypothetical protein
MTSNRELTAEATSLGKKLGVEAETSGLKNDGLTRLVERLRAEVVARESGVMMSDKTATEPAMDPVPPVLAEPERELVYTIARRRSVTSRRGILPAGTVVTSRDFAGGDESLAELVASGTVIKS